MTGVVSAMKIMVVKNAAKAGFVFSTGIAKSGSSSSDKIVTDLTEEADGNSSAKTTLKKEICQNARRE